MEPIVIKEKILVDFGSGHVAFVGWFEVDFFSSQETNNSSCSERLSVLLCCFLMREYGIPQPILFLQMPPAYYCSKVVLAGLEKKSSMSTHPDCNVSVKPVLCFGMREWGGLGFRLWWRLFLAAAADPRPRPRHSGPASGCPESDEWSESPSACWGGRDRETSCLVWCHENNGNVTACKCICAVWQRKPLRG